MGNSTSQNNHDHSVAGELKKLPAGTTTGEYFARALELGASPALLESYAICFISYDNPEDSHQPTSLPYIGMLLAAGWSLAEVRAFVEQQCFTNRELCEDSYHRDGFLNNEDAWQIFETADQLVAFLQKVAQKEPRHVLTPAVQGKLTHYLGELCNNEQQNQRDIRRVEDVAASHLNHIDTEHQLDIMVRAANGKSQREQTRMACQLPGWGWNLVFTGYVLARLSSTYDRSVAKTEIRHLLHRHPKLGPEVYRWLLVGFQRANPEHWQFRLEDSGILLMLAEYGWEVKNVIATPQGTLQVTLPGKGGTKTAIQHIPGDEPLQVGDEVIVSLAQLEGLTPVSLPGTQRYTMALTPARPPTADMLANTNQHFFTRRTV